ncbi:MAG: M48 family metallopeptidase [Methanomassiliicoccaceae archaeon]|nr:M48 family metallopeptidase [Methanomassiliicoccaceae archaeon]
MNKMQNTDADRTLRESFGAAGKSYGYDSVSAEFREFKEFKVKWSRSNGWADFEVSDYTKDAPPDVLEELAKMIFSRISGKEDDYPEAFISWITADEFVRNKQSVYLSRCRNVTRTPVGKYIDLNGSYDRLEGLGLVKRDVDTVINWTKQPNVKRVGYCSVLMKVVTISSVFDDPSIPEFVSDFVLYHELIHIKKGFDPFGRKHGPDFRTLERLHPQYKEAEDWLKRLRLYV